MVDHSQAARASEERMVLAAVRSAAAELRRALGAERDALDARDPLALDAATAAKAELLQRLQLLGAGADPAAAEDAPATLAEAWRDIRHELDVCRRMNATNGVIVDAQLRHVRRALDILGGGNGGAPNLYGPHGHLKSHPAQRSLTTV